MYLLNEKNPWPRLDAPPAGPGGSASLTYESFYGLREKAFSLSADPRFLFRSPAHGPAFDELLAGIRRREGLIVLTGEIGTGKTTLCRSVLQQLDRRTFSAFVADPFVSREDLLKTLLVDFGVISIADLTRGRFNGASRSDLSYPLYEFLDSLVPLQAFAVVVIDEAQNLSLPLLEEIRILSELERREKLLQVVLVGQPELRANLRLPQMRQVDQRVSVRCELGALDADGVSGYVHHRLKIAGAGESRLEIPAAALEAIHRGSSGVPRLINRICDRALQRAFGARSLRLEAKFVWSAIEDLGLSPVAGVPELAPREAPPNAALAPAAPVPPPGPAAVSAPPQVAVAAPVSAPAPAPVPAAPPVSTAAAAPAAAPGSPSASVDRLARAGRLASPEPALAEFASEASLAAASARSSRRTTWAAAAVASLLAASASVGGAAWYARAHAVDAGALAGLLPPRPAAASPAPGTRQPLAATVVPVSPDATAAAPSPSAAGDDYTILVASFTSRSRADRLVEELTTAGYRAGAVERDFGPPRGRLVVVSVGGYASALDVQRDLQRIRELPGGYGDALIVARE